MASARLLTDAEIPDRTLIDGVLRGDHDAFGVLYERYFPRLYGFVNRRIRNRSDVEETVQEIFFSVFSSLDSYRGEAPFAAWVLGVARRTVASRFKKKQHVMVSLDDADADPGTRDDVPGRLQSEGPTPLDHYECSERFTRMQEAAREVLSDEQWEQFALHHLEHRSVREIARVCDKSEDSVKSNLYRARKLLLAR